MTPKRSYKRGYPVAVLVGFDDDQAVLWRIFSNIIKHEKTLLLDGDREDSKATYTFHESVINALRPTLKEGVRSIILASLPRTGHAREFISHVHEHHAWLIRGPNKAAFSEITGSASTLGEVATLTRTPQFHKQIVETTFEETRHLVNTLEKQLNSPGQDTTLLYSLEEIETLIFSAWKPGRPWPEHLMLTDKYLSESHEKSRIHRLIQIAKNKNIKTKIIDAESAAGKRLTQLGGLVSFTQLEQPAPNARTRTRK